MDERVCVCDREKGRERDREREKTVLQIEDQRWVRGKKTRKKRGERRRHIPF